MKTRILSKSTALYSVSTVLAYAAFHGLSFGATFVGETIGVNFQGRNGGGAIALDDLAGVLAQRDWNNIDYGGGGGNGNVLTTNSNLIYDDGALGTSGTSSVSISVQANDSWNSGSGTGSPNNTLLNGIIKANGGNTDPTLRFTGLSSGTYQVIVYTMENGGGANYSMSLGGTTYYGQEQNGPDFNGTFIRNTNTSSGSHPVANYVQFDSVFGAGTMNIGFHWEGGSDGAGIAGIQLKTLSLLTAWSGTVSGVWNANPGGTANWSGGTYNEGDSVLFGDLDGNGVAPVTRNVAIQGGGVSPGSVRVENSAGDYTFGGGSINGAASVIKSGSSALILNATNAYSGGTAINGGSVKLGVSNALPSGGAVSIAAGATLDLNGGNQTVGALTATGTVTSTAAGASVLTVGSGALTPNFSTGNTGGLISNGAGSLAVSKTTAGTLSVYTANTYSDGTTISAGTLSVGDNAALGGGTVSIGGNATLSFVGKPGLSEGLLSGSFNTNNGNPNTYIRSTTALANVTTAQGTFPNGIPNDSTAIYTGYINNPGNTPVTWTFAEGFDDSVLLKVNGTGVINNNQWDVPTKAQATLNPGLNSFELRLGQGGGGVGPDNQGWFNNNLGVGVDTQGRDQQVASNYTALPIDSGNGAAFVASVANAFSNAVTVTGEATLNVGYNIGGSGSATVGQLSIGTQTLHLTGVAGATTLTSATIKAAGTAITANNPVFDTAANTTFNPGSLDDFGVARTITKSGGGRMQVDTQAGSVNAGSVVVVTGGTLGLGSLGTPVSASPLGSGSVTLASAGVTLSLDGMGAPGLLGEFYNNGTNQADYATLASLNAHLNGLTPAVTTMSTTGGKLDFDFSNDGYGGGAPFNIADHPTRAAYGFSNNDNIEARWTGYINVTNAGLAHFEARSDDGTMVFINGTPVVTNNFFQGATTRTGDYNFTNPGLYQITLAFNEGGGGAGALFQWNQAGGALHTLLNSEVAVVAAQQTFNNNVLVLANSTISVSNSLAANIGALSIGGQILTVSSPNVTAAPYSLTAASTTLTGNATFNVTNSAGGTGTFAPNAISGGANSITKTGNGILLLDKANTYSGGTTVSNGTLLVSNTLGSGTGTGSVNVQAGGKLSGAGTIAGSVSILGTFAPGSGVGTALTILSPVTIGAGSILSYDLASNGVNSTANISGSLTLSGAETLNVNELADFSVPGTYVLATATSVANGATFTINQTGPAASLPGITLSVSVVGGNQLVLTSTTQNLVWAGNPGATGDLWNNVTLGNWTGPNPFLNGYNALFNDIGIGQNIVNIGTVVKPWTTTFDNSSGNNYGINGDIGGTGGILKTNSGLVYLATANSYTGNTVILGGTIRIDDESSLGTLPAVATAGKVVLNGGQLLMTGGTTINSKRGIAVGSSVGTINIDSGVTVSYGGTIANVPAQDGVLAKAGDGTLTLTGVSTFTGGTVVDAGILRLNVGGTAGTLAGSGPITINNGGTLLGAATDAVGYFNHLATNGIFINAGGTLSVAAGSRLSVDRSITSVGGIIAAQGAGDGNSNYTLRDSNGAVYTFTSTTPTLVGAGNGAASRITASNIGLNGVTTFNVTAGGGLGADLVDLYVSGNIIDNFGVGTLTKAGDGVMVLAAVNTYTGDTNVNGGKLYFAVSETLTSLNIAAGATAILGAPTPPPPAPFGGEFAAVVDASSGGAAVPEPGSATLLFGGLLTILGLRRRA